jgi:hypothetical protein
MIGCEAQLQGYFVSTDAKFAILTNGLVYKFYTDIEKQNILDNKPFMILDVLNIDTSITQEVERFSKINFNANEIFLRARELKYAIAIKRFLSEQLHNPSDKFINLAVSAIGENNISPETPDEFRPLVKTTFAEFIRENTYAPLPEAEIPKSSAIEQEVVQTIRDCVKGIVDPARITLTVNKKWSSVYYRNCVLCKLFTFDKDYCQLVFLQPFMEDGCNWRNRKNVKFYEVSNKDDVTNYFDDYIQSKNDIDEVWAKTSWTKQKEKAI